LFHKNVAAISPEAKACLCEYSWPGNISELQTSMKRAVIFASESILPEHLSQEITSASRSTTFSIQTNLEEIRPMKEVSREVVSHLEKEVILRALERSGGNKVKTARWLEIDYKTLFNKIKQYDIVSHPDQGNAKVFM
jgi:sigma-54 dependent transcriptional regulator, acetoin dehydrogenase operon transcriptional activator AcoR